MTQVPSETRLLVQAALPQVPFDGWSQATLNAAATEVGIPAAQVAALLPRGAYVINVGRGEQVVEDDLRALLETRDWLLHGLRSVAGKPLAPRRG